MKSLFITLAATLFTLTSAAKFQFLQKTQDPFTDAMFVDESPCSCDCCLGSYDASATAANVDAEGNAEPIYRCQFKRSGGNLSEGSEAAPNNICREQCLQNDFNQILKSAIGGKTDHTRYCPYSCKPQSQKQGAMCRMLTMDEIKSNSDKDGNGDFDANIAVGQDDEAKFDRNENEEAEDAIEEEMRQEKQYKVVKRTQQYDIRKIVNDRRRTEATASVSSANAAEERAKFADVKAQTALSDSESAVAAIGKTAQAGTDAELFAKERAEAAEEDMVAAQTELARARAFAQAVATTAAKETVKEIKARITPDATKLAEVKAQMYGWTKPDFWGKILASRASDPYMQAMSAASAATAAYDGAAKGMISEAQGYQKKAQNLAEHLSGYKAVGDKLGAAETQKEMDLMLKQANALEGKAKQYYATAQGARKTIPEFQKAGTMAATRMAWEYANTFTPPPSF